MKYLQPGLLLQFKNLRDTEPYSLQQKLVGAQVPGDSLRSQTQMHLPRLHLYLMSELSEGKCCKHLQGTVTSAAPALSLPSASHRKVLANYPLKPIIDLTPAAGLQ